MLDDTDDIEFDALLRTALADRPEPRHTADFAARVLLTTAAARKPSAWPVVIAAIAMAAVVAFGFVRVAAIQSSLAALTGTTTALSSTATAYATDSTALLPFGGIAFLIVAVWLTARSAFDRGEAAGV